MNIRNHRTEVTTSLRNLRREEGLAFELAESMPGTDNRIIFPDGQNISFNRSTVDAKSLCDNIRAYILLVQNRLVRFTPEDHENYRKGLK